MVYDHHDCDDDKNTRTAPLLDLDSAHLPAPPVRGLPNHSRFRLHVPIQDRTIRRRSLYRSDRLAPTLARWHIVSRKNTSRATHRPLSSPRPTLSSLQIGIRRIPIRTASHSNLDHQVRVMVMVMVREGAGTAGIQDTAMIQMASISITMTMINLFDRCTMSTGRKGTRRLM